MKEAPFKALGPGHRLLLRDLRQHAMKDTVGRIPTAAGKRGEARGFIQINERRICSYDRERHESLATELPQRTLRDPAGTAFDGPVCRLN